jgi:hypothetical protein
MTEVSNSFAGMSLANIVSRCQELARMVRALKYLIGSSLTTHATKSSPPLGWILYQTFAQSLLSVLCRFACYCCSVKHAYMRISNCTGE